ncbi:hypothetical protein ACHAPO_009537 [Fusarium lateritium]
MVDNIAEENSPLREDIVEYVRQCCKDEQINPPVLLNYGDIPVSYESITKEWLVATLAPDSTGTTIKSFTLGPKDDGSANRRRIEIEWEGVESHALPTSIFCKAAHSAENRIVLAAGGTYSEVCFYNHIRPQLNIEAPWAYFAGYNPKSWAAMVLLRDMGNVTTFCNYKTTLTKTQFAEQIQILAKLHGQFYQSQDPNFERLLIYKDRISNLIQVGIETMCNNGFEAAEGHWSRDLAYVLGTVMSSEKRRLWEHEMVELYLSELKKHGGPKVTADEAWLELRRQSLGALAYWTLTLTPSEALPDMQSKATSLCFIGRICTMINDHDVLDAFDYS